MADVLIDNDIHRWSNDPRAGSRARLVVDVDSSNIYTFFLSTDNGANPGFYYRKSTDGGQNWGSRVQIAPTSQVVELLCVYYDKWTSGDSGTKIHLAWGRADNEDLMYNYLDTSGDTLGTAVTVDNTLSDIGTDGSGQIQITKARGGNIYILATGWSGADWVRFARSTDGGGSFGLRNTGFWENDDNDYITIYPANLADANDIWLINGKQDPDGWHISTYDDSANSWSAYTAIFTGLEVWGDNQQLSGAIRHSDGHLILAIHTLYDNNGNDLTIWDVTNEGTITQKTNIFTDKIHTAKVQVYIDQNTDDIYVVWIGKADGSENWTVNANVWYSISTDGGANWGTPVQYNQDTANHFQIWTSCGVKSGTNGRFGVMMYIESNEDMYWSYANSVQITGSGATTSIKTIDGISRTSVKTVNGLAIANVKTWNGLA